MKRELFILVFAVILAPLSMRADTAAQLAATINSFSGGGTGKLTAAVAGNTVTVTGSLTGVTSGTIPGADMNYDAIRKLAPEAMKGLTPEMIKSVTSGLTLNIDAGVTVVWKASISAGSDFTMMGSLLTLFGSGTFEIAGGKIEANDNEKLAHAIAVRYKETTLTVSVSSGTVSATKGEAISHEGKKSKIIVSGTSHVQGSLSAISTNGNVEVSGNAVVSSMNTGNVIVAQTVAITGTGIIIGWNQWAGNKSYAQGSSDDIILLPASATAVWDMKGTSSGISYANGSNTGFIPLDVTVK